MIHSQSFPLSCFYVQFSSYCQATDGWEESDLKINSKDSEAINDEVYLTQLKTYERKIPRWLVANCSSILSLESMNGVIIIPALFLNTNQKYHSIISCTKKKEENMYV